MKRRELLMAAGLATALAGARAQGGWPTQPVRLVVPAAPGGAPDLLARLLSERLSTSLKQPFVVENRPGGSGSIAMETVANAARDGYTLLCTYDAVIVANPALLPASKALPRKVLTPVAAVASTEYVLSVNPRHQVNLDQLIALAKRSNPPLSYATPGNGLYAHLAMEVFKHSAGLNILHVPYRGAAAAMAATIAGDVDMTVSSTGAAFFKAGKLRAVATLASPKSSDYPDLPSIARLFPEADIPSWMGMFAPIGTPEAVVSRLRTELAAIVTAPGAAEAFSRLGAGLRPYSPSTEEFDQLLDRQTRQYERIVKLARISLQ